MEAFIITMMIVQTLNIGVTIKYLSEDYPRVKEIDKDTDMIVLLTNCCIAIWAGYLLF